MSEIGRKPRVWHPGSQFKRKYFKEEGLSTTTNAADESSSMRTDN